MATDAIEYRRTVEPGDARSVRRIVASSGFFNPEEIEVAVELVTERLARGAESGYHFIFADRGGRTVGYACFGPIAGTEASFDLYWIAVENAWRNQRIGRALLGASEAAIRRTGGRRIYVETSSRDQYAPTRAFYLANGYRLEATLRDFYAPGDSKHIFIKEV